MEWVVVIWAIVNLLYLIVLFWALGRKHLFSFVVGRLSLKRAIR